jgi:MinD-like ATPase involved in chromosome partitioning or flagellar assembly
MTEKASRQPGQIITFYSYKGGTGRTMALANIGCLLANQLSSDDKILMIDWDLEAPGLHHYFKGLITHKKFKRPEEAESKAPGLIELLLQLNELTPTTPPQSGLDEEKYAEVALSKVCIEDYVLQTHEPNLFLMKAGSFAEGYADKTSTFDWEGIYMRSPLLFFSLAQKLAQTYKYVLIDSRTGLTDTSGICTMLMPEKLVLVFTPNRQSLSGVLDLVRNATAYRRQSEDLRPLMIFPLPSRIETSEPKRREIWRFGENDIEGYEPLFEHAFKDVYGLQKCSLERYFDDVQVQHVPPFAYGEEIAALTEKRGDKLSLTRTYQTLLEKMVFSDSPWEEVSEATIADYASVIADTKTRLEQTESEHIKSRRKFKLLTAIAIVVVILLGSISLITYRESNQQVAEIDNTLNKVSALTARVGTIQKAIDGISLNPREIKQSSQMAAELQQELMGIHAQIKRITAESDSAYIKKEVASAQEAIDKSLAKLKAIKSISLEQQKTLKR